MRISDWSSDVCSSDLVGVDARLGLVHRHDFRLEAETKPGARDALLDREEAKQGADQQPRAESGDDLEPPLAVALDARPEVEPGQPAATAQTEHVRARPPTTAALQPGAFGIGKTRKPHHELGREQGEEKEWEEQRVEVG